MHKIFEQFVVKSSFIVEILLRQWRFVWFGVSITTSRIIYVTGSILVNRPVSTSNQGYRCKLPFANFQWGWSPILPFAFIFSICFHSCDILIDFLFWSFLYAIYLQKTQMLYWPIFIINLFCYYTSSLNLSRYNDKTLFLVTDVNKIQTPSFI